MYVIGIVGSPAGGKSTVAGRLEELGATWVNADLIAHSVLEQPEIQRQLVNHFGIEITNSRGQIDRSKLARRVFGDDETHQAGLEYLESLVHPQTRRLIKDQLKAAAIQKVEVVVLDVPLMFESGWDRACDEIWCVDAHRDTRIQRVGQRGWSPEELQRREANQLNIQEKKRLSSVVINNSGSLEELNETIDEKWRLIAKHNPGANDLHCG